MLPLTLFAGGKLPDQTGTLGGGAVPAVIIRMASESIARTSQRGFGRSLCHRDCPLSTHSGLPAGASAFDPLRTFGGMAILPSMPQNQPPYTDADYYGSFMTGLFGLVDDAELSGYSPEGTALLRQAQNLFWQEFRTRHPDAWTDKSPPPEKG